LGSEFAVIVDNAVSWLAADTGEVPLSPCGTPVSSVEDGWTMLDTLFQSTEHPAIVHDVDWITSFRLVGSSELTGELGFINCCLRLSIVDFAPV
jgi:hypothetical protein